MGAARFIFKLVLLAAGLLGAYAGGRAGSRAAEAPVENAGETREHPDDSGAAETARSERKPPTDEPGSRTTAEWITLAVSTLVVSLLLGAALYEHFARDEPPGVRIAVELALDQAEERNGITYIPFTVRNDGREPAENVVVRFEVKQGEETVEESTAEFPFLANSGSAEGELATSLDLSTHTVETHVATIQKP